MIVDGLTVAVAVPDNCGRLIGKRLSPALWKRVVETGDMSMPSFHLITGLENVPLSGFDVAGAHKGFGDGTLRPDMESLRLLPWDADTAVVFCDAYDKDGVLAETAPRTVLRRQIDALADRGLHASCASELEFYLFRTSYEEAFATGYRDLAPAYHRHGDHDLLVDGHLEHVLGEIRALMPQAGIPVELSQGEGGVGQFEVTLVHCTPLEMADRHVLYKHGVKQIANRHNLAATFMAKVNEAQPGSSCHLHLSLQDVAGRPQLPTRTGLSGIGKAFLGGLVAYAPEFCLLHAPYGNSYRRLQPESWAPANATWGLENRTTMVRICGVGDSLRFEFRLPGADVNPYLSIAALLAAGIEGIDRDLAPPPEVTGSAYDALAPPIPGDIAEAVDWFARSEIAIRTLGAPVHQNLLHVGVHERDIWRRQVTDKDVARCFEPA